jgi:archaellum component FlaC
MQRLDLQNVILSGVLCGGAFVGGCSAAPEQAASAPESQTASQASPADLALKQPADTSIPSKLQNKAAAQQPPQRQTQLIKKATLSLSVQNLEKAIQSVTQIVDTRQGDLLGLKDEVPEDETIRRTASLTLRVPKDQLDKTLTDLGKLGVVDSRSIQVEDVSSQLVDFESRLRNLRKSEETVLKIMDRSGSVGDVLKVSQELSNIRNSIEQIDGQVQSLKRQVAYSTVTLSLKAAIAQTPQGRSVGNQLQDAWTESTHSMGVLTTRLIQLGVWMLVFSPYLIGLTIAILAGRKILARKLISASAPTPQSPETQES